MTKLNVCKNCGKQYVVNHHSGDYFCSRECWKQYVAPVNRKVYPVYDKICIVCGGQFQTKISTQICCSKECQKQHARDLARESEKANFIPKECTCKECGVKFMTTYANKHRVFCSDECAKVHSSKAKHLMDSHKQGKRKSNNKRKSLIEKSKATFTYEDIYVRDNGICKICGLPVIKDKLTDYDWSGCIDHIKPICNGGQHTIDNCQLSHRICNCLKDKSDSMSIDWPLRASSSNIWKKRFEKFKTYNL